MQEKGQVCYLWKGSFRGGGTRAIVVEEIGDTLHERAMARRVEGGDRRRWQGDVGQGNGRARVRNRVGG